MKQMILLLMVFGSFHANAGTVSLISIVHPAGMMRSIDERININSDGSVMRTTTNYPRGRGNPSNSPIVSTVLLKNVDSKTLAKIEACVFGDLQYSLFKGDHKGCQDDAGTHYRGLFGENEFAVNYCDNFQITEETCAKDLQLILDRYDEES